MRTTMTSLAALALLLAGGTAAAMAQQTQQPSPGMMGQHGMMGQGMWPGMMGQGMGPGMMMGWGHGMMGHGGMRHPGMMALMIVIMDTNNDGSLSLEEVQAVHARIFNYMDADKDGKLTPQEVQAVMGGVPPSAGTAQ